MKRIFFCLAFFSSLTTYAQQIMNEQEQEKNTFTYKIGGYERQKYSDTTSFTSSNGNKIGHIGCFSVEGDTEFGHNGFIVHETKNNDMVVFQFTDKSVCEKVVECLDKVSKPSITISAERSSKEIKSIKFPQECSYDEWASASQSLKDKI